MEQDGNEKFFKETPLLVEEDVEELYQNAVDVLSAMGGSKNCEAKKALNDYVRMVRGPIWDKGFSTRITNLITGEIVVSLALGEKENALLDLLYLLPEETASKFEILEKMEIYNNLRKENILLGNMNLDRF